MPTPAPTFRPEDDQPTGPPRSSSNATVALVIALVGIFLFGVVLGPIAIVIGIRARTEIDESRGQLQGRGKATAAIFIGAASFIVGILWIIAAISG